MNNLAPCPFCGQIKTLEHYQVYDHLFGVICNAEKGGCGARGGLGERVEGAALVWNHRSDIESTDQKPSTCIGDPMSCETNQGYGCYCTDKGLVDRPRTSAEKWQG